MNDLAERCEAATGPDPALDDNIWEAVDPEWHRGGHMRAFRGGSLECPAYTASLDAARTLVPPFNRPPQGERIAIEVWDTNGVYPEHVRASAWVFGAPRTYAATPALALCAAALRARSGGQS